MGIGQYKNINRSLEKNDFNSPGWFWSVLYINCESNWSCGRDSKNTSIRIGIWRYFWIATISFYLNAWRFSSYMWAKKKKKKWFLEMNLLLVKMLWWLLKTRNDLEYYINLVDKAMAGIEWIDSLSEIHSSVGKAIKQHFKLQRSLSWNEEVITVAKFVAVLF